ncbi:MAG: biopolymer transporter ExbD [Planctomycetaceae bacterium]|jgi:biopolymer transport protein ExbD|nr:biopolymer transporter ExbD [Planctomycetaceae bacterium]
MKASRKKKRRKVQVPIASMGDIAFLLIIFFMLLSEFSKDKDLPIELPRSDQVKKTEIVVVARVAVAADGVIYFDGDQVDSAKDIEWGVRALLSKTVADEQRHVQFKCDASLSKEQFEPVLKAIAEGGGIIEAVGEDQ